MDALKTLLVAGSASGSFKDDDVALAAQLFNREFAHSSAQSSVVSACEADHFAASRQGNLHSGEIAAEVLPRFLVAVLNFWQQLTSKPECPHEMMGVKIY
jgi:hypothetical protein